MVSYRLEYLVGGHGGGHEDSKAALPDLLVQTDREMKLPSAIIGMTGRATKPLNSLLDFGNQVLELGPKVDQDFWPHVSRELRPVSVDPTNGIEQLFEERQ